MGDNKINDLINSYKKTIIKIEEDSYYKFKLGFINNNCTPTVFGILVHCMENLDIFNETQLNNIQHFISKLQYGS